MQTQEEFKYTYQGVTYTGLRVVSEHDDGYSQKIIFEGNMEEDNERYDSPKHHLMLLNASTMMRSLVRRHLKG
jgi:hypothetical protein